MIKKEIGIGFLIGILATSFGFFTYLEYFSNFDLKTTLNYIIEGHILGSLLGLAALPNFFVFLVFLKKKQEYRARGVVLASFFIAFLVLIAQFL